MKNRILYLAFLLAAISLLLFSCEDGPNYKDYSTYYPEPTVAGINPVSGYPGTYMTIDGNDFGELKGAVKVWFGGIKADSIISCANNQIVVKVPSDAVSGMVTMQIWTYLKDSIGIYSVIPAPKMTGVEPQRGKVGSIITITGENFGIDANNIQVLIGGVKAVINTITNNEIKITLPDAGSGL